MALPHLTSICKRCLVRPTSIAWNAETPNLRASCLMQEVIGQSRAAMNGGTRMILYRAIVGSRLYGTNRPDSDYDWLEVHSSMRSRPRQVIQGNDDTIKVTLSTFILMASEGRHQMLEAMFAPKTDTDMFYDMRRNFYPNTAKTVNLYRRTIYKFGDHKMRKRDKAMQTALRMTYNLEEFLEKGRFDPVLDTEIASVLPCMSWQEAHDETFDRMQMLNERYNL